MFKVGDRVERTGADFDQVKCGHQYVVKHVTGTGLLLEDTPGGYYASTMFKKIPPPGFWMVYNPRSGRRPRVQHPTYDQAVAEAQRLARLQPDDTFYVLAVSAMVKAEVSISTTEVK